MNTSVVIKELETVAGFAQQDGNILDFRDSGNHCFFIDKSFKVLKAGSKYRLTVELIQDKIEE